MKLTSIVYKILKEQEAPTSPVTDVLNRFKILRLVLEDLLTSSKGDEAGREDDLTKLIGDIQIIVFKPATFKIKFKNGSSMILKYNPTPQELDTDLQDKFKPRDYFQCQVSGKKFDLGTRSSYLNALEYIGRALAEKPVGGANQEEPEDEPTEEPEDTNTPEDNEEEPGEE